MAWTEMPKNDNARKKTNTQNMVLSMGYIGYEQYTTQEQADGAILV